MMIIKKIEPVGSLKLGIEELAEYIYDATQDEPCSLIVYGIESDLVFLAEFEDVPQEIICFDISKNYMKIIKNEPRDIEKELRKLKHITRIFTANVKLEITPDLRKDVDIIN